MNIKVKLSDVKKLQEFPNKKKILEELKEKRSYSNLIKDESRKVAAYDIWRKKKAT
tara:strand:- start:522 stop:689 length:168 start_codon:yes stop_codon:yes gene_type:complete